MFEELAFLCMNCSSNILPKIQDKGINLFQKITNLFPLSTEGRVDYFGFLTDEIYIFLIHLDCCLENYFRWSMF